MNSTIHRPPRRSSNLAAVAVLASLAGLAGCEEVSTFRFVEARPDETIFSPIDLPAPDTRRNGAGAPGPDYWQQRADYVMAASLDAERNRITGEATITYTNNSPDALDYLWLHLEQNIFRSDSIGAHIAPNTAIGMSEAFGHGVTIDGLRMDGIDLPFQVYDTLMRVDLPTPVQPDGGQIVFDVAWHFTIPDKAFRRFGIEAVEQGTIYEIAQWFPAMAVYDDVHGWNTLPYAGTGEFYTDFGDYDVRLTVPRSHLVAATGLLQNPYEVFTPVQVQRLEEARQSAETVVIRDEYEVDDADSRPEGDGPLTWHFTADNVRTFAWASSDAYIYDACDLDGVLVQSVYPKEALPLWKDSTQMLRTAIKGYSERWFMYPYPAATNVNGPEGGMEYPMIIFCRARTSERGLYGVTTHEIGHNWFPMIVSTDERRHAWMDEGFNTFINYYSYGEWFDGEHGRRGAAAPFAIKMLRKETLPMVTYPDHLSRGLLRELNYEKTAVGLVLLREQILGPERFDFAFRTYIQRWAFKNPRPADFFRCMEDASGADLAWFWRGWFLENGTLDQAIRRVWQRRDGENFLITVTLDNKGELVMPVVLEVTYEDKSVEERRIPVEVWFNSNRVETTWTSPRRAKVIEIDATRKFPDIDR
ncbi:MAG: M1 family metallopeptidase, partial [Planctomycetota bacterium]